MKHITVREMLESFLEIVNIKLTKNEEYEKVMGWYDEIIAVPKHEYNELMKGKEQDNV